MCKLIMLGTGNGGTFDLFNTCFVVQNSKGNFLVDAGGSIEIINRLSKNNIDFFSLKHIFISHSHTDHIFGLIWLFKRIGVRLFREKLDEKINIYCNDIVCESIKKISECTLPKKLYELLMENIRFVVLNDGDSHLIYDVEYVFFDIMAKGEKQYGFTCKLNEKSLAFLGDETLNSELYYKIKNFDYVMHESFCLDSEEHIFHAYEKNHSTTKSVSLIMNNLNVKNLILYHTEESHKQQRKKLYTTEAQKYFNGNIIVPDDLEIIKIK